VKLWIKAMIQKITRQYIGSVPEVPHDSFVRRLQCKSRERICFSNQKSEMRVKMRLVMLMELQ
jgi:hypothetical protein